MTNARREVIDAAQAMLDRYGETAASQVRQRIAELEARGEHATARQWIEIGAAVKVLSSDSSNRLKQ